MSLSFRQIRDRALELLKLQYDALFTGGDPITDIPNPYDPARHRGMLTAIAQAVVEHWKTNATVSVESAVTVTSMQSGHIVFQPAGAAFIDITFDLALPTDEYGIFFSINPGLHDTTHDVWSTSVSSTGFTANITPSPGGGDPAVDVFWLAVYPDTPFGKASGSGNVA